MIPKIGQIYRHFKGNEYVVQKITTDAETLEPRVVYTDGDVEWDRPLHGVNPEGKPNGWGDPLPDGSPRFVEVVIDPNLKVYGGTFNGTIRMIVAAKSKAAALRALQTVIPFLSAYSFRMFGGQTHNPTEIEIATREPGAVFSCDVRSGWGKYGSYRKMEPKKLEVKLR